MLTGKYLIINALTYIIMRAGILPWNTYANGKEQEKSSGGKKGAGVLPAPKILIEKVLTNVSGCAIIRAQKTKGVRKMKTVSDHIAAEELFLYTVNNSTVYSCSIKPLIANYRKKISKNQYDNEKAVKGFENIAKIAAIHYEKEFLLKKYYTVFNAETRREAAKLILEYFEDEIWEG